MYFVVTEEAKAAAEELSRSPVMGQRNYDPASSPLQSRGSGSSENWPQQSDEDIDRLVAMHQNRSSLSSLGVSIYYEAMTESDNNSNSK